MQEHEGSKLFILQKQNTQDSRQDLNGSSQSGPSSNVCNDKEMEFSLDTQFSNETVSETKVKVKPSHYRPGQAQMVPGS